MINVLCAIILVVTSAWIVYDYFNSTSEDEEDISQWLT